MDRIAAGCGIVAVPAGADLVVDAVAAEIARYVAVPGAGWLRE